MTPQPYDRAHYHLSQAYLQPLLTAPLEQPDLDLLIRTMAETGRKIESCSQAVESHIALKGINAHA